MVNLKRIFNIGVPSDMDPVEAKYVGMSNIGAFFFILSGPPYIVYFLLNAWMFLVYEQLLFMAALAGTFVFNHKRKYTPALIWFGSVLNYHLVILSVAFGWEVKVYYLIFFTAGGAIMLFRRHTSSLIVPSVVASFLLYVAAYFLSLYIPPLYHLSTRQIAVTNAIIEVTFFVLVVVNAMIGRYGSIASEDQLKLEMAKSNDLLQQLRELDRQKTQFFQNISHEFRTPLTLILGPLEAIAAEQYGRLERPLKEQLAIVRRNAGRLLGLINQLLDLAKLDEKKMPLRIERGDMAALAADTVTSFTAHADKLGIKLAMTGAGSGIDGDYDPQMMEKVLINLISNALKFTATGGRVDVAVAEIDGGKNIAVSVRDTGKGIPPEELPHIFDRFHQVDGTMTRNQEGTGIGLSLVKEFVELHGGRIDVESAVDKGSEFRVILPKETTLVQDGTPPERSDDTKDEHVYFYEKDVPGENARPGRHAPAPQTSEHPAHVLIVDDNEDMRNYIRQTVGVQYRTMEAADGEEGLKKARETMPDVIISDVMMPKMDGYELCRRIKNSDALKDIPVILLTARASEEMALDGIEAGAYDYITKPFSPKILLAKIGGILQRQELHKKQIRYDSLTGLLNREAWGTRALQEMEKSHRRGDVFSVAFLDLDNFKNINDTYGHQTGDEVLKELASLVTKNVRASDLAGRLGGEEFVVFFPETTGRAAADSLERILKIFRDRAFGGDDIHCTFSAGVAEKNPLRELTLEDYVSRADEAMYAAKKSGKARIFAYRE